MDFQPWTRTQLTPAQRLNARAILSRMRRLISANGWTNLHWQQEAGGMDLARALAKSTDPHDRRSFDSPAVIVEAVLTRWLGMNIFSWNDTEARSKEHVIEILDGLIAALDEKEKPHGAAADSEEACPRLGANRGR